MKKQFLFFCLAMFSLLSCSTDKDDNLAEDIATTFKFSHNWDGSAVTNAEFNSFQFVNANGETISIQRLRYLISDIIFTTSEGDDIVLDVYNLVDVTNNTGLIFTPETKIPSGEYTNVSFTFGFDNEDNYENHIDLNSESFNVPDMLGGGYHYMQFDGKYLDENSTEQNFNYHAIRAVDNAEMNPTFPQDTFFTVNLGAISITDNIEIEVKMDISQWFENPNIWDLNELNTVLMPNSSAQIMMFENGQTVFSLGEVFQ